MDHGNTSLGQLARLARRRPSTISKSADSLVRLGLLTRTEDAEDRRIMALALTPAGSALIGEAREAMSELARWLVSASGMDTASLAVFIDDFYEQTEHAMDNLGAPLQGWLADSAATRPARLRRVARTRGLLQSGLLAVTPSAPRTFSSARDSIMGSWRRGVEHEVLVAVGERERVAVDGDLPDDRGGPAGRARRSPP